MEWVQEPAADAATLIQGDARCRVWYTPTAARWAALISVHSDATTAYNFASAEEAHAWCEAQLAERSKPRG